MKDDISLLVLDEPTNHLDIASREWIEQAISEYGGTLLFVSHDRWFVDRFADRIWELHDGTVTDFQGDYQSYQTYKSRRTDITRAAKRKEPKEKAPRPSRPADRSKQLAKAEREIEKLEGELACLEAREQENATDYQKLMELAEERAALQEKLDEAYDRWAALSE
ncbi:MAG: hypothetical protein LUE21_11525 [Oscillospiraceae bacterium]|nr:hypothetical protein [Oscillospiraceae bacterium]